MIDKNIPLTVFNHSCKCPSAYEKQFDGIIGYTKKTESLFFKKKNGTWRVVFQTFGFTFVMFVLLLRNQSQLILKPDFNLPTN